MTRALRRAATLLAVLVAFSVGTAWGASPFVDIAGNTHEANIEAIRAAGIASGCDATHYCPDNTVTRAQMGTFLARVAAVGKNNFPKTNAKSDRSTYCALRATNPGSFLGGPCARSVTPIETGTFDTVSIAVGANGLPIFVFQTADNSGDLRFARCTSADCTTFTVTTLDSTTGNIGQNPDIVIGADGLPLIAYDDVTNNQIRLVHCLQADCGGATAPGVFASGANTPALAIGSDGLPIISYFHPTGADLFVSHCLDVACAASDVRLVDNATVGPQSSIAIGADGLPVFSYTDTANQTLKVAHCVAIDCLGTTDRNSPATGTVDSDIAIGSDGLPIIVTRDKADGTMKAVHCANAACSSATVTTIGTAFGRPSVAIGFDGLPVIAYSTTDHGAPAFLHCTTRACDATDQAATFATGDGAGGYQSIAVGIDGQPVIAYRGSLSSKVIVARPAVA